MSEQTVATLQPFKLGAFADSITVKCGAIKGQKFGKMRESAKFQMQIDQISFHEKNGKIVVRQQKYSSFTYFQLKFLSRNGDVLGKVENKKESDLKKQMTLGQKATEKEKKEVITLKPEEVVVGVKLGIRDTNMHSTMSSPRQKVEEIITSIQFIITTA